MAPTPIYQLLKYYVICEQTALNTVDKTPMFYNIFSGRNTQFLWQSSIMIYYSCWPKRTIAMARNMFGSWLTALPIKSLGYTLKQEFRDSVCLRND